MEQEPVLFSDTVYKNILFGRDFDERRYQRAVEMSCLKKDFQTLSKGEETIVGEKGITLSGGQKARLALARALYGDADICLLYTSPSPRDQRGSRMPSSA